MAEIKPPVFLEDKEIEGCRSFMDAVLLCWNTRRVKYLQNSASELLGIYAPHFGAILKGKKYLPGDKQIPFQVLCGNWAISQYLAKEAGHHLSVETLAAKVARLERENQELREKAA